MRARGRASQGGEMFGRRIAFCAAQIRTGGSSVELDRARRASSGENRAAARRPPAIASTMAPHRVALCGNDAVDTDDSGAC